ncbi:MAG: hypothetical protein Q8P45_02845, partial [Candidatus Harrisonbacteria bacterium]|nr:hypothetical protein [Candidatus Harrisonbacteria bacterium]
MIQKIGIIGLGFVGSAVENWLEQEKKYEIKRFDTFKRVGSLEEIHEADLVFLCLPTPYDKKRGYDASAL